MPAWVLHPPVEPVGASFARSVVKQQYFRKRMHDRPLSECVRCITRSRLERAAVEGRRPVGTAVRNTVRQTEHATRLAYSFLAPRWFKGDLM